MITDSVEIDRPPAEVFAYLDQLERHSEWQQGLVSTRVVTEGPVRAGTRVVDRRKVPGGERDIAYEVTEHDPPRRSGFQGTNGPVRPVGSVTVEPLDDGQRSRVTLELDFTGHGLLGKLVVPLARRQAAREVPQDHQTLKRRLESGV